MLDITKPDKDTQGNFHVVEGEIAPEKNIPVQSFQQISSLYNGQEKEDSQHLQIRTSEYTTHRKQKAATGKETTNELYCRFPDVAKSGKCLAIFRS